MRRFIAVLALLMAGSLVTHAADPYHLIKEIPIKVVATAPIGNGADGAAFDPATGYAFASNGGDGTVTIAHLDGHNTLTVVQTLPTLASGRTMILDPVTHNIFVPAARTIPNPGGRGRPVPVAGTFKVLMYGMR